MHDMTGFQRDLLCVLAGLDEPKGLDVKAELDDYYASAVNHGRLYPNLDRLAELGFVEKGRSDDRTNSYVLTEQGRRALADRRQWEDRQLAEAD